MGAQDIRVVVAEDSLLVREGIAKLLAVQDGLVVVALCEDLPGLLEAVEREQPDVVLTDIRMPPTGTDEGIRAAAALRQTHPSVGVVVLSQYAEPAYALELLDSGSAGRAYLLKERLATGEQLVAAIREVHAGGSVVDPKVVEVLVQARTTSASPLDRLTPPRAGGAGRDRPGQEQRRRGVHALSCRDAAVEKHINSLFSKLGLTEEPEVNRRVKAVLLYLSHQGG